MSDIYSIVYVVHELTRPSATRKNWTFNKNIDALLGTHIDRQICFTIRVFVSPLLLSLGVQSEKLIEA